MTTYKDLIRPAGKESKSDQEPNDDGEKKHDWSEVLKRAWEIRNFEIELFWKRSTYFSVLVGALFIAYYTLEKGDNTLELLKELIAFRVFGFLCMVSVK